MQGCENQKTFSVKSVLIQTDFGSGWFGRIAPAGRRRQWKTCKEEWNTTISRGGSTGEKDSFFLCEK